MNSESVGSLMKAGTVCCLVLLVVVAVLVIVLWTVVAFSKRQLTDNQQPLALPEGSVRSLIALTLVLLFGVTAFYVFGEIGSRQASVVEGQSATDVASLIKGRSPDSYAVSPSNLWSVTLIQAGDPTTKPPVADKVVSIVPHLTPSQRDDLEKTATSPLRATHAEEQTFTVRLFSQNQAADDLGKQVVTMLGTVLTTIVGFYFGAGMVQTATSKALNPPGATSPTVTGVNPPTLPTGTTGTLTLVGTGLDSVQSVSLINGTSQIVGPVAQAPSATPSQASFNVNLAGATVGAWSVNLLSNNKLTPTTQSIQVTSATGAPPANPVVAPNVTSVQPPTLASGSKGQLTLLGTGLNQIQSIQLTSGASAIQGTASSTPAATSTQASFDVDLTTAAPGQWSLGIMVETAVTPTTISIQIT